MKSRGMYFWGFIFLIVLLGTYSCNGSPRGSLGDEAIKRKGLSFFECLQEGNYKKAWGMFGTVLKVSLPPHKLKQIWEGLNDKLGKLKERKGIVLRQKGNLKAVIIRCHFERGDINVRVVFNTKGKVVGLWFVPVRDISYTAPSYVDKSKFYEKEVVVGKKTEYPLPATLSIPKGKGRFPAVILVHGSGPNDRDETVGANKPFKDIAWGLATRGIAILRYDKRTKVYAQKLSKDKNVTPKEEVVDDVGEAILLLKKIPQVDPSNIFVLGHSFGGTMIPEIAKNFKGVRGFIVLAGAMLPIEDKILTQTKYICSLDGNVTPQEKKYIKNLEKAISKIKTFKRGNLKGGPILGAYPKYWHYLLNYSPYEEVKKVKSPLLILQGGRDYQCTLEDFKLWKKALANRKNVTFKVYPSLNHLFMKGEGKSGPKEYNIPSHVDEEVIIDICNWISTISKR